MIPAEHKETIISAGIEFMRSITECYGNEKGMKLWDDIASTLGNEIKGEIFFAMISGEYTTKLKVSGTVNDRIASIKAIRAYTGLGLKEAKDLWDKCKSETVSINTKDAETTRWLIKELKNYGCLVL